MKNLLFVFLALTVIMCACTKTNEVPNQQVTASEENDLTKIQLTNMLTAHKWIYQEYYSHYVDEQHKGQRFYDRDSTDNFDEYLGDAVYTFYKNHSFKKYIKYDANTAYNYWGRWNFSDNKPTYLTLDFQTISDEKDSVTLFNSGHLNYFRVSDYHKFYTALIPKNN